MHTVALLVAGTTCFFALWLGGGALSGGAARLWCALSPASSAARQARALLTAIVLPLLLAGLLSAHATWTAARCALVGQERGLVGPCVHATRHLCAHVSNAMTQLTQGAAWGGAALAVLLGGIVALIVVASLVQSRRHRSRWMEMPPSRKLRRALSQVTGKGHIPCFETAAGIAGAAMVGWFKPRCLVAQSFVRAAHIPELRVALRHELAHAARRDNLARVVVNLCRQLLFFFPPVLWLCREWEKSVEFACDDAAAQTPQDALHLASALVKACRLSARGGSATALIGEWSTVEQRVQRLIRQSHTHDAPLRYRRGSVSSAVLFTRLFVAAPFIVLTWTLAASFDLSLHCAVETLARLASF